MSQRRSVGRSGPQRRVEGNFDPFDTTSDEPWGHDGYEQQREIDYAPPQRSRPTNYLQPHQQQQRGGRRRSAPMAQQQQQPREEEVEVEGDGMGSAGALRITVVNGQRKVMTPKRGGTAGCDEQRQLEVVAECKERVRDLEEQLREAREELDIQQRALDAMQLQQRPPQQQYQQQPQQQHKQRRESGRQPLAVQRPAAAAASTPVKAPQKQQQQQQQREPSPRQEPASSASTNKEEAEARVAPEARKDQDCSATEPQKQEKEDAPTAPASAPDRAVEVIMKIEISEGQFENLEYRTGDDVYDVALAFVKKHGMDESVIDTIADALEQQLAE